jgi:hypothetical protein
MLAFLDKAVRRGPLELQDANLRYELFSARDRLRFSLIKGETEYNKWFKYLDTTLTQTIHSVRDVNPVIATFAMMQFQNDPAFDVAYHEREAALMLDENRGVKKAYRRYIETIGDYLTKRHSLSLRIMVEVMMRLEKRAQAHPTDIHTSKDPKTSGESVAPFFSLSPQTSTLLKYGMASDVYRQSGAEVHMSVP